MKSIIISLLIAIAPFVCNGMEEPENLNEALIEACRIGDLNAAQLLVESGASVNALDERGNTSLHIVIRNNSQCLSWNSLNPHEEETVQFLLDNKANMYIEDTVPFRCKTPLYWAIFLDKIDIVNLLFDNGAIYIRDYRSCEYSNRMGRILNAAIERQEQLTPNSLKSLAPLIRLFRNNQ